MPPRLQDHARDLERLRSRVRRHSGRCLPADPECRRCRRPRAAPGSIATDVRRARGRSQGRQVQHVLGRRRMGIGPAASQASVTEDLVDGASGCGRCRRAPSARAMARRSPLLLVAEPAARTVTTIGSGVGRDREGVAHAPWPGGSPASGRRTGSYSALAWRYGDSKDAFAQASSSPASESCRTVHPTRRPYSPTITRPSFSTVVAGWVIGPTTSQPYSKRQHRAGIAPARPDMSASQASDGVAIRRPARDWPSRSTTSYQVNPSASAGPDSTRTTAPRSSDPDDRRLRCPPPIRIRSSSATTCTMARCPASRPDTGGCAAARGAAGVAGAERSPVALGARMLVRTDYRPVIAHAASERRRSGLAG